MLVAVLTASQEKPLKRLLGDLDDSPPPRKSEVLMRHVNLLRSPVTSNILASLGKTNH